MPSLGCRLTRYIQNRLTTPQRQQGASQCGIHGEEDCRGEHRCHEIDYQIGESDSRRRVRPCQDESYLRRSPGALGRRDLPGCRTTGSAPRNSRDLGGTESGDPSSDRRPAKRESRKNWSHRDGLLSAEWKRDWKGRSDKGQDSPEEDAQQHA